MFTDPDRHEPPRWTHPAIVALAVAMIAGLGIGAYFLVLSPKLLSPGPSGTASAAPAPAPAQAPGVEEPAPQAPLVEVPPPAAPAMESDFAALQDRLSAQIGIAFAPVGNPGQITTMGAWSSGPAWSTIKVPLSMALLRENGGVVTGNMRAAITASDNGAAQAIWEELGAHQTAADKVGAVLADAGETVAVNPEVTRPGFSAFGQTTWSLADQVRFLAHSACTPGEQPVLDLMGEVISGQRWGLGTLDGARLKGGWGPGTDGLYLVRQYGLIPGPTGDVAVAIAAVPNSGAFGDGTAVLSEMGAWLAEHLSELPAGQCGSAGR